ncbi:MAG: DNA gyrase subunit A [Campylobacterales bacterium]
METLFDKHLEHISIEDTVKTSYLDYSMSVIVGRALPDAKDGLKPVHRRILFAMNELNLTSRAGYKKSARIVGDVIGKYHPHGDSAVYEALVRMAQEFSMRAPLVDGQGNFGSLDGDSPAAMRYTEARMTILAEEMLRDIDKDTVDFTPNYDDTMKEPDVLPTRVPNLLLNGSSGIAVGMATNIPPHRLDELVDAVIHLIDNKDAEITDLTEFIQGPDFPTGGIIFGKSGIIQAYKTGRGRIKIRAKTHIEKKGNRDVIVLDELPYQTNKAKLVEQIAELAKNKHIEGISEVRDESDREGIRVVVELKKDAMSEIVLNNLFKSTSMESTFGINVVAINNKEPKTFNLLELLKLFVSHRKTVVIRRTIFDLQKAKHRAHILEGLRIAVDNIDEIVKLIRASADPAEAKSSLKTRFELSDVQTQAILDMRLQKLTGLERDKIEAEYMELLKEIERLNAILKSEDLLESIIKEELLEIKQKYGSPRRTEIVEDYEEIDIEDLIPNEPAVITMTHRGYIKRVPLKSYEKQRRGGKGKMALTVYEDDFIENFFISNTHDTIMFVTDRGQLYWLKVYRIPEASRNAKGKAVVNLVNLAQDERIMATITTSDFEENKSLLFVTKKGVVKRTNLSEYSNIRSVGVRAITLDEEDELVTAQIITPDIQEVFMLTSDAMCIRFPISDVREIGRVARGVTGIRFKNSSDCVVGAVAISSEDSELLTVSERGLGKRTKVSEYRCQNRGGKGIIAMKLTNKTGQLVGALYVDEKFDLMALTKNGNMIRVDMEAIRKTGRNASGVKLVNIKESDDRVISIAACPNEEAEEEITGDEGASGLLE